MDIDTVRGLCEYGDARFGDEWWPSNARAWLGDEDARDLAERLRTGSLDAEGTVRLMERYAAAKFGDKWRPDANVLGRVGVIDVSSQVGSLEEMAPQPSM